MQADSHKQLFAKKKQAIVMDAVDGTEIKDYIIGIVTKTALSNIITCSKISQNSICYLSSIDLVESIIVEAHYCRTHASN